ncbi:MAG: transglycosylase domain-containing protein [Candidatus Liptonbacteria bacterium]|nr:transglycosylase domain-containing protein [Candidatus Liptonbacteria bacterium]
MPTITISRIKTSRIVIVLLLLFLVYGAVYPLNAELKSFYAKQFSPVIVDRNGERISLNPNYRGYYAEDVNQVPENFKELLIKKEDRFFYYHLGINPFSVFRDGLQALLSWKLRGSSTLTQQLVKNLLGNENRRTVKNKIIEALYTLALELYTSKDQILKMYANTVYFGNQMQGVKEASLYYYGRTPEALAKTQTLELLAALNNPSARYPGAKKNEEFTAILADKFGIDTYGEIEKTQPRENLAPYTRKTNPSFEVGTLNTSCEDKCALTIDASLTETLRNILQTNLKSAAFRGVDNGAIVVIKLSPDSSENELLAVVGTPDPSANYQGKQINMALKARPIGSTAKPFIYAKAFEKGARPYTLVDDREYKYKIGTGFYLYPKNFDGKYRGIVTLHQALSNSLNVPTVKTLDFVGVDDFNNFLQNTLQFYPRQKLENYELGIALGGLEMDLLTLSHYFTIFPNEGILKPLKIADAPRVTYLQPPMTTALTTAPKKVVDAKFIKLVNKILSDRVTGVDQFGLKSNLNLTQSNYAVKTGTTYNFHDSWAIGYTPDFLVGVWVGNSSNQPIRQITGQQGAGKIWHDAMEFLLNSPYNKKSEFNFDGLKEFDTGGTLDCGLPNDHYQSVRNLIEDNGLILEPHNGDVFAVESGATVPLHSREEANWYIDGKFLDAGDDLSWPPAIGVHQILAETKNGKKEKVEIEITKDDTTGTP